MALPLPSVIVPVFNSLLQLDACVASLDRSLPAGSRVLIADDASSDPQVEPMARAWCKRSKLDASYLRSGSRVGLAANCAAAIASCAGEDVLLLHADAVTTPGWLQQIARCAATDLRIATITAWSNRGDLCSFPLFGEDNPLPQFPEQIAEAAAGIAGAECPHIPAAVGGCLYLRRAAMQQIGGLDVDTFTSALVLDDFCRRAGAMGWRNVLCPGAFVARSVGSSSAQSLAAGDELSRLLARWPDYQEQVAMFILSDPLRPLRDRLQARIDEINRSGPQRDLFN